MLSSYTMYTRLLWLPFAILLIVFGVEKVKTQAIICSPILHYDNSSFCGKLVPPKMCMYAISVGYWDANAFTEDGYQQVLSDFDPKLLCPKSPSHSRRPTKRSYCHADPTDGLADGPCETNRDCLKQMVCYDACVLCFNVTVCEFAAKIGGIAQQNQTICYNPVPVIARVYWDLPLYWWIMIAGFSLTVTSVVALVAWRMGKRKKATDGYNTLNHRTSEVRTRY